MVPCATAFMDYLDNPHVRGNLPDRLWARLKEWAAARAFDAQPVSLEQCVDVVHRLCRELTGNADVLRPDVVAFYAGETEEMVAAFLRAMAPDAV